MASSTGSYRWRRCYADPPSILPARSSSRTTAASRDNCERRRWRPLLRRLMEILHHRSTRYAWRHKGTQQEEILQSTRLGRRLAVRSLARQNDHHLAAAPPTGARTLPTPLSDHVPVVTTFEARRRKPPSTRPVPTVRHQRVAHPTAPPRRPRPDRPVATNETAAPRRCCDDAQYVLGQARDDACCARSACNSGLASHSRRRRSCPQRRLPPLAGTTRWRHDEADLFVSRTPLRFANCWPTQSSTYHRSSMMPAPPGPRPFGFGPPHEGGGQHQASHVEEQRHSLHRIFGRPAYGCGATPRGASVSTREGGRLWPTSSASRLPRALPPSRLEAWRGLACAVAAPSAAPGPTPSDAGTHDEPEQRAATDQDRHLAGASSRPTPRAVAR